jgi:hypothetical protein
MHKAPLVSVDTAVPPSNGNVKPNGVSESIIQRPTSNFDSSFQSRNSSSDDSAFRKPRRPVYLVTLYRFMTCQGIGY